MKQNRPCGSEYRDHRGGSPFFEFSRKTGRQNAEMRWDFTRNPRIAREGCRAEVAGAGRASAATSLPAACPRLVAR